MYCANKHSSLVPLMILAVYERGVPLFELRVLQSVRKAFSANADSLQDPVAGQLVQNQLRVTKIKPHNRSNTTFFTSLYEKRLSHQTKAFNNSLITIIIMYNIYQLA